MALGKKGQAFSWVWAIIAVGVALFFATLLWVTLDQARYTTNIISPQLQANQAHMAVLNALWALIPFVMLLSFGLFVWIVAAATRGGDYV